jgi:hypothetical protein
MTTQIWNLIACHGLVYNAFSPTRRFATLLLFLIVNVRRLNPEKQDEKRWRRNRGKRRVCEVLGDHILVGQSKIGEFVTVCDVCDSNIK